MASILYNPGSSDRVMSPTEAAYVAGFVDGEGCLTIGRAKRSLKHNRAGFSYEALMNISNTNLRALYRIVDMCGNGKIQVQDKRTNPDHAPLFRIVFSSNQIRRVLPQLRQFLFVKARQADILVEFLASKVGGRNVTLEHWQRWENLRAEVRTLNKRGSVNTSADTLQLRADLRVHAQCVN